MTIFINIFTQVLKLSENGVLENVNTKHFGDLRRGKDGKLYIASGDQAGLPTKIGTKNIKPPC